MAIRTQLDDGMHPGTSPGTQDHFLDSLDARPGAAAPAPGGSWSSRKFWLLLRRNLASHEGPNYEKKHLHLQLKAVFPENVYH